MKTISKWVCLAAGVCLGLGLAQRAEQAFADDRTSAEESPEQREPIDPAVLEKVRPLYPNVQTERGKVGELFFSTVRELARVPLDEGKERLAVWVGVTIPSPGVDRGWQQLLIYCDANDTLPMVRRWGGTVSGVSDGIEDRWLPFSHRKVLVSLVDNESLEYFRDHGTGIFYVGLPRAAARRALGVYVEEGREAFLQMAPIRPHREQHVNLPERIERFDIYPSLVEESRVPGFKYYNSWEATLFIRLTPEEAPENPVVLEMGARGLTGGIDVPEVELLLWETRDEEPIDRPGPEEF